MEVISSFWFNTQFTLGRAPLLFRLKAFNKGVLSPAIQVDFENDLYQVKTANTAEEIAQVLSLRFEVFFREFSTKKVTFSLFPYDVDLHDFLCDHLIVKDKTTNKVVACYRLLANSTGKKTNRFYSEGEFVIDEVLDLPGGKLELGRACVHRDFRKGAVISLLWRGLLDYARKSGVRYMFGCSSINRKDFGNLPQIYTWLRQNGAFIEDVNISVRPKYSTQEALPTCPVETLDGEKVSAKALGSLMYMYVMAGAKLGKVLAYDAEMDCMDMFTLIDLTKMPDSFVRRFS